MIKNFKYIHNSEADLWVSEKKPREEDTPENCCLEKCPRKIAPSENL